MKNRTGIILIIVFAVVFLVTSVLFKVFGITDIWAQLTGTLLGTIITAIVTVLLLGVQTNKEISHDRDVGVFEKKQEVYFEFIKQLWKISENGNMTIISGQDDLQKVMYQLALLQMHIDKDTAEKIMEKVGRILRICSNKSNEILKAKKYAELSEQVFAIVGLLRKDLYNQKDDKVVDKTCFHSIMLQSGLFPNDLRNAGTMKILHIKWWELFLAEMKKMRGDLDYVFYYDDSTAETNDVNKAVDCFEDKKNITFSLIVAKKSELNFTFYMHYDFQTPPVYGFEIECKPEDVKKESERKYADALPEGYSRTIIGNPGIGARNIEAEFDIDFYGTNKNYFVFADANNNEKKEIVGKFAEKINNDIEKFIKNSVKIDS